MFLDTSLFCRYVWFSLASGVATGWHGWTMSMGLGAKGAPERETKKRERKGEKTKNRKEKRKGRKEKKRKEKRERNFSNTRTGAHPIYPHESIDDRKYQTQTLVIITQSLKYKRNNGELGPHVFFFSLQDI